MLALVKRKHNKEMRVSGQDGVVAEEKEKEKEKGKGRGVERKSTVRDADSARLV